MKSLTKLFAIAITSTAVGLAGCAGESDNDSSAPSNAPAAADDHDGHDDDDHDHDDHEGHDHDHPSEGPHHGNLIELGNEEYHAEVVHDEKAGSVTIYVLDAAAKKQIPIESTEITINAKHDGKPEQFKLAASPDENDGEGKSSRFVSTDKELAEHLDEEGADPQLVLEINGKSYRGKIAHDHDHGDHDHDKHDH